MGLTKLHLPVVIIAAALCLLSPANGAESVVRARLGGAAELGCSLAAPGEGTSAPLHVVEWVRLGYEISILIKFGVYAPRVHPNFEGRVSLTGGTALRVEGLLLEDGGWYECRILLLDAPTDVSHETYNGTWTFLSVTAPPVFSETSPPVQQVLLGNPLALRCIAHGSPPPTVTWEKDGVLIDAGDAEALNGTLSLRSVSRETAGRYTCHASNSEGNVTHVTQLKVKGPPVILIPPSNTTLNMSQNAQLRCQAEADPPNMTYVWQRQGENVYHIETLKSRVKILVDGTLIISRLTPVDSGNYTCMPTNGLLTPPTASAYLTVRHPAQVSQMAQQTYLPTGMRGFISCPVRAAPPLLRVDWTKNGQPLDLGMYPGWTLTSEGSVFMAMANDDAVGVYTCTPYNSYGTMGQSQPTTVILQDPPSFRVAPQKEYRQEVGRMLVVPCQTNEDQAPSVNWSKVGSAPRSLYTVAANGSLILQPLSKDHQGEWECSSTNRVATASARTMVFVLGTSPHTVSSVSVSPGIKQAIVSWKAGFNGGYTQKFTIWLKRVSAGEDGEKQEWVSVPVLSTDTSLLLTGLLPNTEYQFSVLAHNKMGSGHFSKITTATILDAPHVVAKLEPPTLLTANQSSAGIVLQWSPPISQSLPFDGFVLQSRVERGEWFNLDEDINVNKSELLLQGLRKDCVYELRLLSRRGEQLSKPSPSINVSTMGMDMYPASSRILEYVHESLLAGVMGGVGFLCFCLLLALVTVCIVSHRRAQRHRKRDDLLPPMCKSPPVKAGSPAGSPDSVLKQKLLPLSRPHSGSSSSSQSDHSSFDKSIRGEYHCQRQQLLPRPLSPTHYSLPESHLSRAALSPTSPLEFIYRGPDGRFMVQPYEEASIHTSHIKRNLRKDFLQYSGEDGGTGVWTSQSLHSHKGERKNHPFVLSVDLPPSRTDSPTPTGLVRAMAKHLSQHGRFVLAQEQEEEVSDGPPDLSSVSSEEGQSWGNPGYLSLTRASTRTGASTLVLQMEHERESGNLSRCLTLAREREQLEWELRKYTINRSSMSEAKRTTSGQEEEQNIERTGENGPIWKAQEVASPRSNLQASRGHCSSSGNMSSTKVGSSSSTCIQWEASPLSSATTLLPAQTCPERAGQCPLPVSQYGSPLTQRSSPPLTNSNPRRSRSLERGGNHKRKSLSKVDQWRDGEMVEGTFLPAEGGALASRTRSLEPELIQRSVSYAQAYLDPHVRHPSERQRGLDLQREAIQDGLTEDCIEMSVDEPEIDNQVASPAMSMLEPGHRVILECPTPQRQGWADGVGETGACQTGLGHWRDEERMGRWSGRMLTAMEPSRPMLRKTRSLGSQNWHRHKSTQSLDSKLYKGQFLTPDAWIDSLSPGRASSMSPFSFRPGSVGLQSKSTLETHHLPDALSVGSPPSSSTLNPGGGPQQLSTNPLVPLERKSQDLSRQASTFPDASVGGMDLLCSPASSPRPPQGCSLPTPHHTPLPVKEGESQGEEEEEENEEAAEKEKEEREIGQEVDVEIGGYRNVLEAGERYRSYASQSSGRGSMDPSNSRQSFSLSPPLTSSPETTEESDRDEMGPQDTGTQERSRKKTSADECYEWDAAYVPMQSQDLKASVVIHGLERDVRTKSLDFQSRGLFPSVSMMASVPHCIAPGNLPSSRQPHKDTVLSQDIHLTSTCYPDHEPDTVLF